MQTENSDPGHEVTTWRARPFLLLLAGFVVLMGIIYFVVGGLTVSWTHHVWPPQGPVLPPETSAGWNDNPPQLQTHAALDLQHLRDLEFRHLHTTNWTDSSRSYAEIPIERAMELLTQAQAENRLNQVLPPVKPATPIDLQKQKSAEAPKSP
jgi:hypothetical protein